MSGRHGRGGRLGWAVLLVVLLSVTPRPVGANPAQPPRRSPATGAGTWTLVYPMSVQRAYHTATALFGGRVLLVGGDSFPAGDLASAELYRPLHFDFIPTGALTYGREQHTATLLPSGQVLIVGGANAYYPTNTANLYNPATGTFTATGAMSIVRADHTATLLRDGRVLVTGGCNGTRNGCDMTWASAEVYNPATGTFTATGSMSVPRMAHTATLLPTGKVLIAGGAPCNACTAYSAAELYDPATGTFTLTGSMQSPRALHTATLLPTGKVLIAGGCPDYGGNCNPAYSALASAELYDPATGTFTPTGSMTTPRYDHTATLLPSGNVLVVGGANSTPPNTLGQPLASAEEYNPWTGTWTAVAPMHVARDVHAATLLWTGQVLVTGGCSNRFGSCTLPLSASAEVFTP